MRFLTTLLLSAALLVFGSAHAESPSTDGGELGAALLAHIAAVDSSDIDQVRKHTHPDNLGQLDEMIETGEAAAILKMMAAFTPRNLRFKEGSIDGDEGSIEFTGDLDGEVSSGSATFGRVEGRWFVKRVKIGG